LSIAPIVRAALVLFCLAAVSKARAGDLCPAPPHRTHAAVTPIAADDHRLHIDSDDAVIGADGNAVLNGRVSIHQDQRSVSADSVTYDNTAGKLAVKGAVDFEDPKLRVRGETGSYDTIGGARFDDANFDLLDRNGRGFAHEIAVRPDGKVALAGVRYTTCPVGNEDWMLHASAINFDTVLQQGVAHGVYMQFKGVPILYTPYISFPLGDERKSGFLFPDFGHSGKSGLELGIPYYFNLAPNYDLTLTPEYLSSRGVQLGAEFRFMTAQSHGQLDADFLPDDAIAHLDRTYFHGRDVMDFKAGLRLDVDVASVSDSNYFQDFAVGSEQTSVTYLERRADLLYFDDIWRLRAQLQNFQTIDTSLGALDRPYSRVPRVQAQALWPLQGSGFEFAFDGEAVNFLRDVGPTGLRLDLSPEFRWSKRSSGYFFEPAAGWHVTQYDLQNAGAGEPAAPTRILPYARLDTGLVFERDAGSQGQRTQTLEPRLVYSYVPYRNQDNLPLFDTGLPDLNLIELFRTNRFVGADRIGDANQVSLGVTTRLFDHVTGLQYLSATLGQTRYFTKPRVTLPGETPEMYSASDIIGQVSLTAYKNWSVNLDYQWNPYISLTRKSEVSVQYRPDSTHVINLGYRFQRDILEQWDASVAWPLAQRWNAVGRMVYSLKDKQTIEQVAGFEYKSCCWRIQLVQRRYVSNRTGGLDTSIALQLELIGLSSVGKREDAFLERSILGYSAREPESR
jgi:LPS-assembly protein